MSHEDYVVFVAWSSDGKRVASASYDGAVRGWNVAIGAKRYEPRRTRVKDAFEEAMSEEAMSP